MCHCSVSQVPPYMKLDLGLQHSNMPLTVNSSTLGLEDVQIRLKAATFYTERRYPPYTPPLPNRCMGCLSVSRSYTWYTRSQSQLLHPRGKYAHIDYALSQSVGLCLAVLTATPHFLFYQQNKNRRQP